MNKTTINTTATAAVNAKFPAKYYDRQPSSIISTENAESSASMQRPPKHASASSQPYSTSSRMHSPSWAFLLLNICKNISRRISSHTGREYNKRKKIRSLLSLKEEVS